MKIDGRWVGYDDVVGPKPPPDRSGIEVGPRFAAPRWLYSDSPRTLWHLAIGIALIGSLLIGPWAFCTLVAVILTINVMKRSPGPTQRSERARLLADCNAQHKALMTGGREDTYAFFGRWPPAPLDGRYTWCAPPQAYPTRSRVA